MEARESHNLLYKAAVKIPVSVIRERVFQHYLTMATEAVDDGDGITFGDFRHYGTLCLLSDELGLGRALGLRTKASFMFMMQHCAAHQFPAGGRGEKIRTRLLTTFFIGCFICAAKGPKAVSAMMRKIKRCFYHDCYLAAYPLSEHVRYHEPLNYLSDAFRSKEIRVQTYNHASAKQLMQNSFLRNLPSIVIREIAHNHHARFSKELVKEASSFDLILTILKKRTSVPTGVYLDNFLTSALEAKLPWTPAVMADFIRVYAEMPRTRYSQAHEDTWLTCLLCYLVDCKNFVPIASIVSVFNSVVAINRQTGLFDLHFDCTPGGITRLRKVFIFTILHIIDINYALDSVLLGRCQKGEFITWAKEDVWHLAKSLPEFRRFMQNSFSERFRVAAKEKDVDALYTLVPFYARVCEELSAFSINVPARRSGFNSVKYHSVEYIPGVSSGLVDSPDWKQLGLTSVLAGNSGRKTVETFALMLDTYLKPAYNTKFGTPPLKRALYDSDDEENDRRPFKQARIY